MLSACASQTQRVPRQLLGDFFEAQKISAARSARMGAA